MRFRFLRQLQEVPTQMQDHSCQFSINQNGLHQLVGGSTHTDVLIFREQSFIWKNGCHPAFGLLLMEPYWFRNFIQNR